MVCSYFDWRKGSTKNTKTACFASLARTQRRVLCGSSCPSWPQLIRNDEKFGS